MNPIELASEIIATYERHGWQLRRLLLRPATSAELEHVDDANWGAAVIDSDFDALWFARSSHVKREAWELRLLADQPYALFEAFEDDESEEDREEARREMENKMRQYALKE